MLDNEIMFFGKKELFSSENYIKLLKRFFSFKNENWEQLIIEQEKSPKKFHLCVRIDNLNSRVFFDNREKLAVDKVKPELWDRDDNDGIDFVLVLILE